MSLDGIQLPDLVLQASTIVPRDTGVGLSRHNKEGHRDFILPRRHIKSQLKRAILLSFTRPRWIQRRMPLNKASRGKIPMPMLASTSHQRATIQMPTLLSYTNSNNSSNSNNSNNSNSNNNRHNRRRRHHSSRDMIPMPTRWLTNNKELRSLHPAGTTRMSTANSSNSSNSLHRPLDNLNSHTTLMRTRMLSSSNSNSLHPLGSLLNSHMIPMRTRMLSKPSNRLNPLDSRHNLPTIRMPTHTINNLRQLRNIPDSLPLANRNRQCLLSLSNNRRSRFNKYSTHSPLSQRQSLSQIVPRFSPGHHRIPSTPRDSIPILTRRHGPSIMLQAETIHKGLCTLSVCLA